MDATQPQDGPAIGKVHKQGQVSVKVGDMVPAITLPSTGGRMVNLRDEAAAHHLVLFFYPGDGAGKIYAELAGCTLEARSFRDQIDPLRQLNAHVFGVNLHTTDRQRQFVERGQLNYELLSDSAKQLVTTLGIPLWRTDTDEEFVSRVTVVVQKGGQVALVYQDDTMDRHVEATLEALRKLAG